MEFSHFDEDGNAVMVDVSGKEITQRRALAEGKIRVSPVSYTHLIQPQSAHQYYRAGDLGGYGGKGRYIRGWRRNRGDDYRNRQICLLYTSRCV